MNIKKLLPIIGIVILIVIILTIDLNEIYNIFSNINPLYLFLAFFTIVPVAILSNIQWRILLKKQKIRVSFLYSLKNIFIGYFYGSVTPGGIGAYTRALYMEYESKAPLLKCISNIIIFNTIDYLSLLLLGAIGAILLIRIYPYLFIIIVIVIIIIISMLLFSFRKDKSKIFFQRLIQTRIFSTIKDKLSETLDSFYEDIPKFRDVILPFSLSLFGWIVCFSELFIISKLFGIEVPFLTFILIYAVANVISSIPITIYGLGTREASLISVFSYFGVIPERVLSFSLFVFVVIWLIPSIVGAFITYFETKKRDRFLLSYKTVDSFSNHMKRFPELYSYLAEIVKTNIPKNLKKPFIVDLGVGPGLLSKEMHKKIPTAKIIGIDPSHIMLKKSKENVDFEDFFTMIGSAEKMPIEEKSADVVVTRFTLAYWDKPLEGFKEIHRVLKPRGRIIIEALNRNFPKWKLSLIKTHMFLKRADSEIIRYHIDAYKTAYNMKTVEQLLIKNGFHVIYREGTEKDWKFIVIAEKN